MKRWWPAQKKMREGCMGVKFIGGKYKKSCQKVSGNDIFWQLFLYYGFMSAKSVTPKISSRFSVTLIL